MVFVIYHFNDTHKCSEKIQLEAETVIKIDTNKQNIYCEHRKQQQCLAQIEQQGGAYF